MKQTIELGGRKFDIKKDALRNRLGLKPDEKFKIGELRKINRTEVGGRFDFRGKNYPMSNLMKKRITLAITLMSRKK